ncbi:MAG: hypothetical protein DRI61_00205 [Chloroflexi bacterium]|nr:MAG: hypothetical protein DRI61_00205 [Chloroflexota bacterium]HDN80343.1 hypothetical protein [Chloroflexota bacterium]
MGRRKTRISRKKKRKPVKKKLPLGVIKWVMVLTLGAIALSLIILGLMPKSYVAIIPGHWGNDSGAICPDGLQEVDVNLRVAELVAELLKDEGYSVKLLRELSSDIKGYRGDLLISIHSDSCVTGMSGFKLVTQGSEPERTLLAQCLREKYARVTGLPFHPTTITPDMEEYYAFHEIDPSTPAAIIEIGFMGGDRELLTQHPDVVAKGIVEGVKCFFEGR